MGKRGVHHGTAFHANPRFKVVGICDIDKARLEAAAPKVGNPEISTDGLALDRYTHRPARHLGGSSTPVSA